MHRFLFAAISVGTLLCGCSDAPGSAGMDAGEGPQRSLFPDFAPTSSVLVAGGFIDFAREAVSLAARLLADGTAVTFVVADASDQPDVQRSLRKLDKHVSFDNLSFIVNPITGDENADAGSVWMRDYGPLVVRDRRQRVVADLQYARSRPNDDKAPIAIADDWDWKVLSVPLQLEGGNLLTDGAGRCVTSQRALDQNPGENVPRVLRDFFGCSKTIVVPTVPGEVTGHVDMFVTLTGPGRALVAQLRDGNSGVLDEVAALLSEEFEVDRLIVPSVGQSYTNMLIVDGRVYVPTYDDVPLGDATKTQIAQALDREVVELDATRLARDGHGAFHCISAQKH